MTRRENFVSLLKKQGYTEVPVDMCLCPHLEEIYREQTGGEVDYPTYFGMPWRNLTWLELEQDDPSRFDAYYPERDEWVSIDSWGVGHRSSPTSMHMSQMLHPLENADSVEQILAYPFPIPKGESNLRRLTEDARRLKEQDLIAVANLQMTVWETSWYLRGMENLMMDMMSDDDMATVLLDKVTDIACQNASLYVKSGADVLFLGDDIGMQVTTMMSGELYREWLKPRLKKVIDTARAIRPDILIFYHSCGFIEPLIDDLIDVGIDVLNPVQPECMNYEEIFEKYGDRLSFHGTIGTQTTMPHGTPAEVRRAVERNLTLTGDKGGLFVSPTHVLEPEVPWENILAYVDACRRFLG